MLTLIVSGIGITNMMFASIAKRLREIGLFKALGATEHQLQRMILSETVFICVIAGLIGVLIGFFSYELIIYLTSYFIQSVSFQWYFSGLAMTLSFVFIFVIGIFSGLFPAKKAGSLDVVTCLRSE